MNVFFLDIQKNIGNKKLEINCVSEENLQPVFSTPNEVSNSDLQNDSSHTFIDKSFCNDDDIVKHFANEFSKRSATESWRNILHGLKRLRELKENKGPHSLNSIYFNCIKIFLNQ